MTSRTEQLIEQVAETRRQVMLAADTLRQANRHLVKLTQDLQAELDAQGESSDRTG